MKKYAEYRLMLEQRILGAIILDGKLLDAELLQPKNFSDLRHKTIFEKILKLYPLFFIDILQICNEFKEDKAMVEYILHLTDKIAGNERICNHVLLLLQIDIKEKFIDMLQKIQENEKTESIKAILNEILIELKQHDTDILVAIPATLSLARKNSFPKYIENKIYAFEQNINNKIKELQERSLKNTLFNYLERLVWSNSNDLQTIQSIKQRYVTRRN